MIAKALILFAMSQVSFDELSFPEIPQPNSVVGLASWYGSGIDNDHGMHGSITATGDPFDPTRKTCATRFTPLRRMVRVRLLRTNAVIWCLVNDRGPYGALDDSGEWVLKLSRYDPGEWRGVIDLSRASAEALGFDFQTGLEDVEVSWL